MSPRIDGGPFGPAIEWHGMTPYVTPRHRLTKTGKERPNFTIEAQLRSELEQQGFAQPEIKFSPSRWSEAGLLLASSFSLARMHDKKPPVDAVAAFPLIKFDEPVSGPLAFGYGGHFGLGQLLPVQ
jgi:CRISPR-associated protein Csb2